MSAAETEAERLAAIAGQSLYCDGPSGASIEYAFRVFRRHLRGATLLELGPAEGVMTDRLARLGLSMTLVEGAGSFCESLRVRHPQAEVVHALFEEFEPARQYDNIVLGHVLEHVEDPAGLCRRVREWLAPDGRIVASVPNARSLHRQAAALMGLLPVENALNELDRHHGHRRVFDPESFRAAFTQAGLRIEIFGGYWLKPVANAQIKAAWTPEMLEAFMQLGERYPDIAGEIYVVATR